MTCLYPEHSSDKKACAMVELELIWTNLEMAQDIWKLFGVVVPIGSGSFVIILRNTNLFFFIFLNR